MRCADIGMSVITFGGGDPFLYTFIGDLIRTAKSVGLFVHVDTNGIALKPTKENVRLLECEVDLIGLPLDGPNAETHDAMRSSSHHFGQVMQRLEWLRPFRSKTKINTIVTAVNIGSLTGIGDLIRVIAPSCWSIYQYWPLSLGAAAQKDHHLDDGAFCVATASFVVPNCLGPVKVEVNSLASRRLTYPFVGNDGNVYIHSAQSLSEYEVLGSIFDDRTVETLFRRCCSERPSAISRYRQSLSAR